MTRTMAELSWTDNRDGLRETDLGIVPVGAVEVYGPHIPSGTDGLTAEALARALAERVGAVVTPLVPVGYSGKLMDFPGTLSVSSPALVAYLRGIFHSLMRYGTRRILVINGHAGNVAPILELLQEFRDAHAVRGAQVDVWRFIQPHSSDQLDSEELQFGHAGEAMTSVMRHLYPELMTMERAVKTLPETPSRFPEINRVEPYSALSDTGVLGDATLGTAEKGKVIFDRSVSRLVEFVQSDEFVTLEAR